MTLRTNGAVPEFNQGQEEAIASVHSINQQPADRVILFIRRNWQNRSMPLAFCKRRHRPLPSII